MSTTRSRRPWNEDPYDLRYDEAAGMLTEDELQVITVDFRRRNRRGDLTYFYCMVV
jgi:hypothetical protein